MRILQIKRVFLSQFCEIVNWVYDKHPACKIFWLSNFCLVSIVYFVFIHSDFWAVMLLTSPDHIISVQPMPFSSLFISVALQCILIIVSVCPILICFLFLLVFGVYSGTASVLQLLKFTLQLFTCVRAVILFIVILNLSVS